jgi:adenylate cyclase
MVGGQQGELDFVKIEKRIWQITLLALAIILYLTLSLLWVQFYHFLGETGLVFFSEDSYIFSVFLCILILLFCAYVALQDRKLLRLSKALYVEKEAKIGLSQHVETLTDLIAVSTNLGAQSSLSGILDIIARGVLKCFKADHVSIMLLDRTSGFLRTAASSGSRETLTKKAMVLIGSGVAGKVMKDSVPALIQGAVSPGDFPETPQKSIPIASSMCVPLKFGTKPIGVLNVSSMDEKRAFADGDLKVLSIFANNAAVAIHNSLLQKEKNKRMLLERVLEKYHGLQVARELTKTVYNEAGGRERTEIAILFADIRGFSTVAHLLPPDDMISFLDGFYSGMNEAVMDNGGNVSKFMGDEVMAVFRTSTSSRSYVECALSSALEMRDCFARLVDEFSRRSPCMKGLGIGIGINAGEALLGNVGSDRRSDYTVIGHPVNLAKRLCSHATSNQILTTASTLEKANGKINSQFVEQVFFKGSPEAIDIFTVIRQTGAPA